MEIKISRDKLSKALSIVSRVAASLKSALPVLTNVLIRAEGKQLILTATNLEIATVYYLNAEVIKEGVITAPARLLAEFVSNLPRGSEVEISVKDGKIITSSGAYKSTLNGIVADDFPELPEIEEDKAVIFKVGVQDFQNSVSEVAITSSNDATRPALTGVYFNTFESGLYMAATDGYRLSERKFIPGVSSEIAAIVPTSSLQEVLRSLNDDIEEIEILFDDSQVRFRLGDVEITSKLIDGSFPNYRQLIPKETVISCVLEKEELLRTTKLAGLFAKESGGSIFVEAKGGEGVISVGSVASEIGENSSDIQVAVQGDGKITLNSRFLVDALNSIEEERVCFGFSGRMDPVKITNEKNKDYTHIIMPLKS
ncbi:DNA polymerase III subunit beta [Clostridia bacterium]|nr:DNA polymerase III subunit beta [Clostridia bacterium]